MDGSEIPCLLFEVIHSRDAPMRLALHLSLEVFTPFAVLPPNFRAIKIALGPTNVMTVQDADSICLLQVVHDSYYLQRSQVFWKSSA